MADADRVRIANECFRKGTEAMNKGNWDYAIDMFGKASSMAPDNLMFRQTRHGVIRKKYDDNGSGRRMASMKLMPLRGKIRKARMKQDWDAVDRLAEEGLLINPWDAQLFADLGESCRARELDNLAVYAYSRAVEYAPDNIEYNLALGHLLRDRGEYQQARSCFERVYKLDPNNGEARQIMGQLDAESLLDRSGYENAEKSEDVKQQPVNAYEADRQARKAGMQQQADGPGQSEEADLQRAIRKAPDDINNYLKLADFYRAKKKLQEAYDTYSQGLETCGEDTSVREQLEDVELDILRAETSAAREKARSNPDDEKLKSRATELARKLVKREIEVLSKRIDRYPNDMRLKFELGQRYKRVGRHTQAIPLLQQASGDARIKEDVLVGLGECFVKDKKLDLGRRQFEKAIESINYQDKPDLFKTAHYWLGRLYEKSGHRDKAENHYQEILALDYEYKDVLQRLESLQGGEESESLGLDE